MKKTTLLVILLLLLGVCAAAAADDAPEITSGCQFELSGVKSLKNLTDRKFTTNSESKSVKHPSLTIESSEPVCGLYLCFQQKPDSYEIQVSRGNGWETWAEGNEYVHAFYALDGVR